MPLPVHGVVGLTKLAGVILPALPSIFNALKEITKQQAVLDREAAQHLHEMALKAATASTENAGQVATWFVQAIEVLDASAAKSLTGTLVDLAALPVNDNLKAALMHQAQELGHKTVEADHEALRTMGKIATAGVAAVAVILAGGAAYRAGRKPTFAESIFGKK